MIIDKHFLKTLYVSLLLMLCSMSAVAIDRQLEGLDGQQHHLNEYLQQGKWVVFNVWGPRCPPCIDEAPELDSFHLDHQETDAIVVGLALDYPSFGYAKKAEIEEFVEDYLLSFPILLLDGDTASEIFGKKLNGVPTSYIVSPEGELVRQITGGLSQAELERIIDGLK